MRLPIHLNRLSTLLFVFAFTTLGCCTVNAQTNDNLELIQLVKEDQKRRMVDSDEPMEPKDKIARLRVMEMISSGLVKTTEDKLNAALILQHTALTYCNGELVSISPENYFMAYTLSKAAFDAGHLQSASFVATTLDRYLLYTEGFQKYGTQKIMDEKTGKLVWAPIDPKTTDEERKKYRIKPLTELLKQANVKPFPAAK